MTEKEKLEIAVETFSRQMKNRLEEKRLLGYTGWDCYDTAFFTNKIVNKLLHGKTVYPIDIANLFMMVDINATDTQEITTAIQRNLNIAIRKLAVELIEETAREKSV